MPKMSRQTMVMAWVLMILGVAGCGEQTGQVQSEEEAREELARAESEWLAAYENDDVAAMDHLVAAGFRITFPSGRIDTKADVISHLNPSEDDSTADSVPSHYTEERTIRIIGNTAILSGIYANPRRDGTVSRLRYTDTWMHLDGRWQVVASHLSEDEKLDAEAGAP